MIENETKVVPFITGTSNNSFGFGIRRGKLKAQKHIGLDEPLIIEAIKYNISDDPSYTMTREDYLPVKAKSFFFTDEALIEYKTVSAVKKVDFKEIDLSAFVDTRAKEMSFGAEIIETVISNWITLKKETVDTTFYASFRDTADSDYIGLKIKDIHTGTGDLYVPLVSTDIAGLADYDLFYYKTGKLKRLAGNVDGNKFLQSNSSGISWVTSSTSAAWDTLSGTPPDLSIFTNTGTDPYANISDLPDVSGFMSNPGNAAGVLKNDGLGALTFAALTTTDLENPLADFDLTTFTNTSADPYVVTSVLADYATQTDIADFITASALSGYATESYVTGLGYQTATQVTSAITAYGYITSSALS